MPINIEENVDDANAKPCVCPAGKSPYRNGSHIVTRGYAGVKFRGAQRDCMPCELRRQCLHKPDTSQTRQVESIYEGLGRALRG
jgi:hypothetical protein